MCSRPDCKSTSGRDDQRCPDCQKRHPTPHEAGAEPVCDARALYDGVDAGVLAR